MRSAGRLSEWGEGGKQGAKFGQVIGGLGCVCGSRTISGCRSLNRCRAGFPASVLLSLLNHLKILTKKSRLRGRGLSLLVAIFSDGMRGERVKKRGNLGHLSSRIPRSSTMVFTAVFWLYSNPGSKSPSIPLRVASRRTHLRAAGVCLFGEKYCLLA